MTDYIEQMMKTAGVEKQFIGCMKCRDGASCLGCEHNSDTDYQFCDYACEYGLKGFTVKNIYDYPDFTPEKQIMLFKLIHQADFIDFVQSFIYKPDEECVLRAFTVCELSSENPFAYKSKHKDFPQALAQLTTELMKAGLDKEKVKEILEK